tara:strand:- start:45 stop:458 length:414 start_codon:yes stop_codon:yes gene_type:complete
MFFEKKNNQDKDADLVKVAALLIHAAKIDQDYSNQEEEIIKQALIKLGANNQNIQNIITKAKEIEENTNQILDFTREVKKMNEQNKLKIIKTLWQIIYSNKEADVFESNLMRRLAGLLYIDNKTMGDIKDKIRKENQ